MTSKLRDALLSALSTLPGTREFHLHLLVTAPRKHSGLFPFAHPRPRAYLQDIVVLVSEQATPDAPRHFVTAIETSLYHFPSTSCALLYVAKVDSTGHGARPAPTSTLVRTLLSFYADPETRPVAVDTLWIQLFARAQSQYLFPNSADFEGKKWLSDVKLCFWWRELLGDLIEGVEGRVGKTGLYYVLPGMREGDAVLSLGAPKATQRWCYGHPYAQNDIPLPCRPPEEGVANLGHFIPYFEDDPKTRFLDEIVCTTDNAAPQSPQRKKARVASSSTAKSPSEEKEVERKEGTAHSQKPRGELGSVSTEEFWERMSFRQECIAVITGYFAVGFTSTPKPPTKDVAVPSPLAPQPGQVSSTMLKRVVSTLMNGVEFSTVERSIWGTNFLEGSIKGLCDGLAVAPYPTSDDTVLVPPTLRTPSPRLDDGTGVIPEVSSNTFSEPVASLDTYHSHIYGSVRVTNPDLPPKSAVVAKPVKVTVLAARKKTKRPAPS